jgi:hypothetical protein
MSDRFTVEILPVVIRYAALRLKCPDLQGLAITLAWWAWSTAKTPDLPATVWARMGVLRVLNHRDLPGVGTRKRDALRHAESGAGMEGLMDRHPGPEQQVIDAETFHRLMARAKGRDREMIEMFAAGMKNKDVANALGISAGRVTQLRQALMEE